MNMQKQYQAARAKYPTMPASQCVLVARHELKTCGRKVPRYVGDDVRIELPRGEYIVARLEYDEDGRMDEYEIENFSRYADWPDCPDWWQSRDGVIYFTGDRRGERYTLDLSSSDWDCSTLGMSRHVAWLAKRACRDRIADTIREAMQDGYVGFVVTLYGADDEEIDANSCWGFEATGDYAGNEAMDRAEYMQRERAEHWDAETIKARETMHTTRETFHALAAECRAIAAGPHTCNAIRARLDTLRKDFVCALRVVQSV